MLVRLEPSVYAATSPADFVAEYITGKLDGETYSLDVDALYKKYNDPKLFD